MTDENPLWRRVRCEAKETATRTFAGRTSIFATNSAGAFPGFRCMNAAGLIQRGGEAAVEAATAESLGFQE